MRPRALVVLVLLAAAGGVVLWRVSPVSEPAPGPSDGSRSQAAPPSWPDDTAVNQRPSTGPAPHEPAQAPMRDESLPGAPRVGADRAVPISSVPHRVAVASGAPLGSGGARGLTLVVAPDLPTAQLEQLLRDAVSHHEDADVLTVKIYDSEEATRYDRHSDGGEFAERHLVASASRHRALGVESLALRGAEIGR